LDRHNFPEVVVTQGWMTTTSGKLWRRYGPGLVGGRRVATCRTCTDRLAVARVTHTPSPQPVDNDWGYRCGRTPAVAAKVTAGSANLSTPYGRTLGIIGGQLVFIWGQSVDTESPSTRHPRSPHRCTHSVHRPIMPLNSQNVSSPQNPQQRL